MFEVHIGDLMVKTEAGKIVLLTFKKGATDQRFEIPESEFEKLFTILQALNHVLEAKKRRSPHER